MKITDQMGRTVRLNGKPKRIVSLVPSQTQLLHFFGLEEEVVGITKFCIHPKEWFTSKPRVGGTKSVDIEKVRALTPDLIIGNKEENQREDILALEAVAPVWMSDIFNLEDALFMMTQLGEILGKSAVADALKETIRSKFLQLEALVERSQSKGKSVAYFIWRAPEMLSGKRTFVDEMIMMCGWKNATKLERYPEATKEEHPDFVFLSSEPFPFKEKHIPEFEEYYPDAKVVLVDGEMFSWYGSKLAEAPDYFTTLIQSLS